MRDGLYKVVFQTPRGSGAGLVYAAGGRLWGGDVILYYVGTYSLTGDQVTAKVRTARHTQDAQYQSVFGIDVVSITLSGTWTGDEAMLAGTAAEAPGLTFDARLIRISD